MTGVPSSTAAVPDPAHRRELLSILTAGRDVQIPELLVETATVRAALVPSGSGWPPYDSHCPDGGHVGLVVSHPS
jgi:hypothetical protein